MEKPVLLPHHDCFRAPRRRDVPFAKSFVSAYNRQIGKKASDRKAWSEHMRFRVFGLGVILGLTLANTESAVAQGLAPQEALARMEVPEGFEVQQVASEPLVRQPVAIEFDDRGRLWVIQYLQYPNPSGLKRITVDRFSRTKYDQVPKPPPYGPKGADRITILEDTNGDGLMDQGRDFVKGLNLATGLAFGHGGVFVLNVPYLLFYPDRNRDDVPDQEPEVLLSGFGMEDAHSLANSLTFGPDGWLYGCQGSTVTAHIRGIEFQQGVWRYHPVTRDFELFCEGGGNSWGLDFDRTGRLFYSTNFGGYVLLHGVQGGYFVKSFGKHGALHNPHAYGYFEHAPHRNFQGGHVTVGGIVYQGDSFPEEFRGRYFAGDLLGHAVYWHAIEPRGSTVQTAHGGTLLKANDPWFAPTDLTLGPEGAVYVADWHDARTAHPDPDAEWDRSNGRIYRIVAKGTPKPHAIDFAKLSLAELKSLHHHKSQWYVRRARQELARRFGSPDQLNEIQSSELAGLRQDFHTDALANREEIPALESLWTLNLLGGIDETTAIALLDSPHAAMRGWTVRFLGDHGVLSPRLAKRLDRLAEEEPNLSVRQQLACSAARFSADVALPIINANILRDEDFADPYLPLLLWWAVEKHSVTGREEVLRRFVRPTLWKSRLGRDVLLPRLVRRYAAERSSDGLSAVVRLLKSAPTDEAKGLLWPAILQGWQEQPRPTEGDQWPETVRQHELTSLLKTAWQADPANRTLLSLGIQLRHAEFLDAAKREAFASKTEATRRIELLGLLAPVADPALKPLALGLLQSEKQTEAVQIAAVDILARFDDPDLSKRLIQRLQTSPSKKVNAQIRSVLLSRPSSAKAFLSAVDRGEIAADSVSLEEIRRVSVHGDREIDSLVAKHWGKLQSGTLEEKLAEVRRLNNDLRAAGGDFQAGQTLFKKHCASCHQLFGEGAKVGPDLTTANRQDRDFLLISLVDPNSVIRREYVSLVIQTTTGRILTGLPVERAEGAITLVDAKGERQTVPAAEVEELHESSVSLMPENLYKELRPQELRDLFAYLQSQSAPGP